MFLLVGSLRAPDTRLAVIRGYQKREGDCAHPVVFWKLRCFAIYRACRARSAQYPKHANAEAEVFWKGAWIMPPGFASHGASGRDPESGPQPLVVVLVALTPDRPLSSVKDATLCRYSR